VILSNREIHKALDEGRIIIDPEPSPRFPSPESKVDCPYNTTSVDLRLGEEILIPKENPPFNIDLSVAPFRHLLSPAHYTQRVLTRDDKYTLPRRGFVMAKTLERVEFPIQDKGPGLAARVEGRSSYARCGLLVHLTAPTIHAGFSGTITLEIANLGAAGMTLAAGVPICQLIIEEVRGRPFSIDSQFQGQTTPGGK
jgi:dCTP deaminase